MNSVMSTWLVARRELAEAFRRRGFWVLIAVLLVGSTAAMVVPAALSSDERPSYEVALVGGDQMLAATMTELAEQGDIDLEFRTVADEDAARELVEQDEVHVAVVPGDDAAIISRGTLAQSLMIVARQGIVATTTASLLSASGLDDEQIIEVLSVPEPRIVELDVDEEDEGRMTVAMVVSLVLYLLLLSLMIQVANAVALEKSNRISEVLLAVVRPGALLFGKVLGVGVIGTMTILAVAIPVVVQLAVGSSLPEGTGAAVAATGAWFVLGLALYLTLAGALGALAERQEQAGTIVAPLTFLLIGTFVAAQTVTGPIAVALAVFPLTSPMMMPFRIAAGDAGAAEIVASVVLLTLSIGALGKVAATIYSRAIVRTGRKLTVRETLLES